MKDHTIRLLQECSQGCKMGIKSLEQICDYIKDDKFRRIVDHYKAEHQKIETEAERLLIQHGQESKPPEKMATVMSWLSTEMKMMMKDDDKQAAKILMEGCNMGVQTICGFINQYSGAAQTAQSLARDLVKMEESFRDEMKAYV